jgi:pimeloyl-ACP methyl ester carboxylesterase
LFDNAGIGLSTGETPDSVKVMADKAAEFIRLLRLTQVDLLGFSLGGYVAQTVTLNYPDLVRRFVLAGTGPGGGEGIVLAGPEIRQVSGRPILGLEETLFLLFSPSEESLAAAYRYWERVNSRPDREPAVSEAEPLESGSPGQSLLPNREETSVLPGGVRSRKQTRLDALTRQVAIAREANRDPTCSAHPAADGSRRPDSGSCS